MLLEFHARLQDQACITSASRVLSRSSASSTASMAAQSIPQTSFLGLPVELRLHVYELVVDHVRRQRQASYPCPLDLANSTSRRLDILAVCKQIFSEAMPVVYRRFEHGPILVGVPTYAADFVERIIVS